MKSYFRHFPIAAPEEDQEDRSILYCLYVAKFVYSLQCEDRVLTSETEGGI